MSRIERDAHNPVPPKNLYPETPSLQVTTRLERVACKEHRRPRRMYGPYNNMNE